MLGSVLTATAILIIVVVMYAWTRELKNNFRYLCSDCCKERKLNEIPPFKKCKCDGCGIEAECSKIYS